jgi:hypothetical protein
MTHSAVISDSFSVVGGPCKRYPVTQRGLALCVLGLEGLFSALGASRSR